MNKRSLRAAPKGQSHLHKKPDSSASNPIRSQFQSRSNIAQAKPQSQQPLTQTQTENQEFQQQKFEATKLELQAKYGTITPEGQEQLTVLQAKMSGLLQRRVEQASSNGSNANISISRPDAPSQQVVQTKLTIGKPGDKYEQEADRVAAQVVNQIHAPVNQQAGQNVQPQAISEEEDLQMKPMLQLRAAAGGMTATGDVEKGIQQARGGGQPLAANIRQPMEQAFGADFSGVKVHTDTKADQLNQSIQAKAFTTGQDVFFRKGEYNPGSRGGQELLAHELTHVVQQTGEIQKVGIGAEGWLIQRGNSNSSLAEGNETANDMIDVNQNDFNNYIELVNIEGQVQDISTETMVQHAFIVKFTLRNRTDKRLTFPNTPPLQWIETEAKAEEAKGTKANVRKDMYEQSPNSASFFGWRQGFATDWEPEETREVTVIDQPGITIRSEANPTRSVHRILILDVGLPDSKRRVRATQIIDVQQGERQEVEFTIE